MIDEVLAAIHDMLPERIFILLPNNADPDRVLYSDEWKATVRIDNDLAVFVVVGRHDGELMTWGEGTSVVDATWQAVDVLQSTN
jgi:hypothetical protein